jgi:hypothetical protein
MAITLSKPQMIWISHGAAAEFWGLDGFESGVLEVTTVADIRRCRGAVSVHRVASMPRVDVAVVRRPVTTVHRTLIDLGACADADLVELALECALRRGMTSMPRLTRRLQALEATGRRGPSVVRKVLQRRGWGAPPTESALETRFLQFVRRYSLPPPDRQVPIHDDGGFVARSPSTTRTRVLWWRWKAGGTTRAVRIGKETSVVERFDHGGLSSTSCHPRTLDA